LKRDLTRNKVAAAARVAIAAVSAMPADADSLAWCPSNDACPDRVNNSGDLMSRDPRVLNARPGSFLCERITVANATSLNLDAHQTRSGFGDFTFNNFPRPIGTSDLHDTHLRHNSSDGLLHVFLLSTVT